MVVAAPRRPAATVWSSAPLRLHHATTASLLLGRAAQRFQFLGGSLGGGVRARATDHLSLGLEGRWHTNISGLQEVARHGNERQRFSLLSLTGGATLIW
jgi:hypothetical protein